MTRCISAEFLDPDGNQHRTTFSHQGTGRDAHPENKPDWRNSTDSRLTTEGRKEMFYLTMHSTHFIYGDMVKDHSDSERGNPLPPCVLLFPISSKGSFICIIPQTG